MPTLGPLFHILMLGLILAISGEAQTKWTWRNSRPQGNDLNAVVWAGNQWVAVGNQGTVLTSSDGKSWTLQPAIDSAGKLLSVAWTGKQLVTVNGNYIYTSADGTAWTKRSSQSNFYKSVTWTGSLLVVVLPLAVLTSSDGVTWKGTNIKYSYNSAIWADTQLVAVGDGGEVGTSPDGVTWTKRVSGVTDGLRSITWTGKQFIAVGENAAIITSPDGVSWTKRASAALGSFNSVTWTGSRALAVGTYNASSTDGVAWTVDRSKIAYGSVAWNGSQAVEVGPGGAISTSPTGETWTSVSNRDAGPQSWPAWTGGEFVSLGRDEATNDGIILHSPDGINWSTTTPPGNQTRFWDFTIATDSLLVGLWGWQTYTSTDGIRWKMHAQTTSLRYYTAAWNGSLIVVGGVSGAVATSPDGAVWTSRASGTTGDLRSMVWTGKRFVAVGAGGFHAIMAYSDDGITWVSQDGAKDYFLNAVAWNGSRLVAVGVSKSNLCALTSLDGVTWTDQGVFPIWGMNSIVWAGNQWVALGQGMMATSPDGVTWARQPFITDNYSRLLSVDDTLLALGGGNILSSPIEGGLPTPKIVSPAAGAIEVPISNLPLTWRTVPTASTYHVQVSTNSLFTRIIAQDSNLTGLNFTLNGLEKFKNYYWRVRAKNSNGVSDWNLFRRFKTLPPPPPTPVLDIPAQEANPVTLPAVLKWNDIKTAYSFHVQVSTDTNSTGAVVFDSSLADTQCVVGSLAYKAVYYWRVRSGNTAGNSAWSGFRRFTACDPPPASPPALIAPKPGTRSVTTQMTFVWSKMNDATAYRLSILASPPSGPAKYLMDSLVADTQFVPTGLLHGVGYYWRVKSRNAGGESGWSSENSFGIIALPEAPKLFFPFPGVDVPDTLPLVWHKVAGATAYHVQLATDTGFANLFLQDTAVSDTGRFAKGKPDGTYYWRVRGKNEGGWGAYSDRWMFKSASPTAIMGGTAGREFRLSNSEGSLHYTLPERCHVTIRYFDMRGKMVRSLIDTEQGPGDYSLAFPAGFLEKGMHIQEFRAGPNSGKNKVMILK